MIRVIEDDCKNKCGGCHNPSSVRIETKRNGEKITYYLRLCWRCFAKLWTRKGGDE